MTSRSWTQATHSSRLHRPSLLHGLQLLATTRLLLATPCTSFQARGATCRSSTSMAQDEENVWDYPRPPALQKTPKRLRVLMNGKEIANTSQGYRVLETSHPPTYYIPPGDIADGVLEKDAGRSTFCEWKGHATYWNVKGGGPKRKIWSYEQPTGKFGPIAGYLSFYAHPPFQCFVDEEEALQQPGDFYGGWKTSNIVGEMKGAPGTMHW